MSASIVELIKAFISLLGEIWWAFALVIALALFRGLILPKLKGKAGEKRVASILDKLPKEKYTTINDLIIKDENGLHQIDHLIVSTYGIFIIETKNYKGIIYGNEFEDYWTQNIYGNRCKFKNPIHQNYGHFKTVETLLKDKYDIPIFPIVAFSSNGKLRVKATKSTVLYINEIKRHIESISVEEKISIEDMKSILNILDSAKTSGVQAKKEQVAEAKQKKQETEQKIAIGICPRCGGNLVERNGKYGPFIGCSNFPKCKFILKH